MQNCILLLLASNTWLNFSIDFLFAGSTINGKPTKVLHEQQLLHTVNDLCCFILHKVVHIDGEFVHPEHELSTDSKYKSLRQWDNHQLCVGYSSVTQGNRIKSCNEFYAHFDNVYTLMMHCNDTSI